jgi:nucleotide-binding universal stress UspA family protein
MGHMTGQRVVACVDRSEDSSAVVSFAEREAKLRDCPLLLVSDVAVVEESRHASLVVVGRPPGEDPGRYEQVAAHAFCPTVAVPAGRTDEPAGRVLVGVAVTPYDEPAIAFAFEEAALWGVPLVAVHVWWGIPRTAIDSLDPFHYDLAEAHATADRLVAEELAGWVDKYPAVPVLRTPLYDVNPAQTLLAATEHADLIVLGANQHGAHTPHLLGPVTRALLARAACPVAVVRHGAR